MVNEEPLKDIAYWTWDFDAGELTYRKEYKDIVCLVTGDFFSIQFDDYTSKLMLNGKEITQEEYNKLKHDKSFNKNFLEDL